MKKINLWLLAIVLFNIIGIMGYEQSPEEILARHLERGDDYYSQSKYREALIEYKNVLRLYRSANKPTYLDV